MVITIEEIKEGDSGVIKYWVNQPRYVGNKIFMKDGVLTMIENGFTTTQIDMRYPHYTKIELNEN